LQDSQAPQIHPRFQSLLTLYQQLELDKRTYGFCAWKRQPNGDIDRVSPAGLSRSGERHTTIWIDEAEAL
jgi:hypothetical protein